MTLGIAKALKRGDMVHHVSRKNADGSPMRANVTSIKTWKTRPNDIDVHVKHGLYDYAIFDASSIGEIEPGEGRN